MYKFNIKVIGVGSAGINIVNQMKHQCVDNMSLIIATRDKKEYEQSSASSKILLGTDIPNGEYEGLQVQKSREAAIESFEEIKTILKGADIVFIVAGFGGGTGRGATPIIAKVAKKVGAYCISMVTTPFKFEGRKRNKIAKEGLVELKYESDTLIVVLNDKIFCTLDKNIGVKEWIGRLDNIVCNELKIIAESIIIFGENSIYIDTKMSGAVEHRIFQNNQRNLPSYIKYFFKMSHFKIHTKAVNLNIK